MKKGIVFAILFTAITLLMLMTTACAGSKYGCPASHSQGRVPGKFKS